MKITSFLHVAVLFSAFQVAAEPASLQETIDAKKAENSAGSSPEKRADYAAGIEAVAKSKIVETAATVGDVAPDFTLTDSKGSAVTLSDELKKGPVVLTWYRGGWCPYCNLQLAAYQQILPRIEELGARLIAISPELPDKSLTTVEKNQLRFSVLSDLNLEVAEAYGLVFELTPEVEKHYAGFFSMKEYNGEKASTRELPLAATYVIDPNGKIVWSFLDADYTKRAEPRDIINALDGIK